VKEKERKTNLMVTPKTDVRDVKGWFNMYDKDREHW
jgi:hypothetical protein